MRKTRRPALWVPLAALPLAGCAGPLSTLEPAGPAATEIAALWWVMFWASLVILAITVALAAYAALRSPDRRFASPNKLLVLGGGVVWPGITVTALIIYGVHTGHSLLAVAIEEDAYQVEITGHQWWWEVRYPDAANGETLHDANEIHIPVGRPVDVHITTADVIHSFWVPRLGGKMDAIPGLTNVIRIQADAPGVYRGQCAEFCGAQHARMSFIVFAHEQEELEQRLAEMAEEAPEPEALEMPGGRLFVAECAHCHSFDTRSGEPSLGPNLARVAQRSHIGAGWFPNDADALRVWARDHQNLKPGNLMPEMDHLSDEAIDQVATFLESIP